MLKDVGVFRRLHEYKKVSRYKHTIPFTFLGAKAPLEITKVSLRRSSSQPDKILLSLVSQKFEKTSKSPFSQIVVSNMQKAGGCRHDGDVLVRI